MAWWQDPTTDTTVEKTHYKTEHAYRAQSRKERDDTWSVHAWFIDGATYQIASGYTSQAEADTAAAAFMTAT